MIFLNNFKPDREALLPKKRIKIMLIMYINKNYIFIKFLENMHNIHERMSVYAPTRSLSQLNFISYFYPNILTKSFVGMLIKFKLKKTIKI